MTEPEGNADYQQHHHHHQYQTQAQYHPQQQIPQQQAPSQLPVQQTPIHQIPQQHAQQIPQQQTGPHHQPIIPPQQQQQVHPHMHHQSIPQHLIPRDDSFIKLKRLDEINASIIKITQSLIQFFDELAKEKQPQNKLKQTKQMFEEMLKHLKKVENDLLMEITGLSLASTGHPHEGSIYGARKDFDLAKMRLNLVVAQLGSLRESLNSPLKKETDLDDEDEDNESYEKIENGS